MNTIEAKQRYSREIILTDIEYTLCDISWAHVNISKRAEDYSGDIGLCFGAIFGITGITRGQSSHTQTLYQEITCTHSGSTESAHIHSKENGWFRITSQTNASDQRLQFLPSTYDPPCSRQASYRKNRVSVKMGKVYAKRV